MSYRGSYLVGMLVLLFLANICMLMGMTNWPQRSREGFASILLNSMSGTEGFMDTLVSGSGPGGKFATAAIGSYDGTNPGSGAYEGWRGTLPNEPLNGPNVDTPDQDNLFIFKNNQCKPECCGATLSCDGGCVCTTPDQRNLINSRGGNRSKGDEF
jgi:hypothetical protein